jgi:acetylornithine/succinyldiaminopimelate/putrescine aminotransferase
VTPALRAIVRARGAEFLDRLGDLQRELPDLITHVQGTGLLISVDIHPRVPVVDADGLESWCRRHGIGVIHGGKNALRFTPHFQITSHEIDLIIEVVRNGLHAFGA